jgi:hypothetical protein
MAIAGGVAELGSKEGQHGFQHARVKGRGGVIIEIHRKFEGSATVAAHLVIDFTKT